MCLVLTYVIGISDGSSGHIFTTAVAVVCAAGEFFTTAVVVAVFECLTPTVAVVMNMKISSANN